MVKVKVPPGTPSGRLLRVRGRGVPKRDGQQGDLLVTVEIVLPENLSVEAREALEAFASLTPPARRDHLEDKR
jgi:molecular chaperone DnaJ